MRMTARNFGCGYFWCLTVLIILPLAGCDQGVRKVAPPAKTLAGPDPLAQASLRVYWGRELALAPGEHVREIRLIDENLYFLTNHQTLIAMDARSGITKWRVAVTYGAEKVFSPTHFNDIRLPKKIGTVDDITNPPPAKSLPKFDAVLINTLTSVKVINRGTGEIIRDIRFSGFSATSCGVTDGERFYVAGSDRQIYAIKLLPAVNVWAEELGARAMAPLLCENNKLFVGSANGTFRCFNADNHGVKQWRIKLDGAITTPFAIAGDNIYIACQDGRVYALSAGGGKELWPPLQGPGQPRGAMLVGESTVFGYSHGGGLNAINLADGKGRWNIPAGREVLAVLDKDVHIIDAARNLLVVNVATGKVSHTVPLKKYEFFAANISAPAIYAATRSGKVCCIRRNDAERLTIEMLKR